MNAVVRKLGVSILFVAAVYFALINVRPVGSFWLELVVLAATIGMLLVIRPFIEGDVRRDSQ